MTAKDALISKIYYDVNGGFGSLAKTLAKAKNIDPTVTYDDVKSFSGQAGCETNEKTKQVQ